MNGTRPKLQNFTEIYINGWDFKSKNEATLLLNNLTDFSFITSIVTSYRHNLKLIFSNFEKESIGSV